MKITLYEFNNLRRQEQYNFTWNYGTFVEYLEQKNRKLVLFAVDLFFVQVVYFNATNEVLHIKAFKTGRRLFKYFNFKGKTL